MATPPPTTAPTSISEKKTRVFSYGPLSVHHIQRSIWGEVMQGAPFVVDDYELLMYANNVLYVDKRMGERVAGKIYELTDEQLKETDAYYGEDYERVTEKQEKVEFEIYRRIRV